jgi:hypothetical protein
MEAMCAASMRSVVVTQHLAIAILGMMALRNFVSHVGWYVGMVTNAKMAMYAHGITLQLARWCAASRSLLQRQPQQQLDAQGVVVPIMFPTSTRTPINLGQVVMLVPLFLSIVKDYQTKSLPRMLTRCQDVAVIVLVSRIVANHQIAGTPPQEKRVQLPTNTILPAA